MAPVVSIMMPAYNAERYIEQAIESVLAQTETRWELIIVDDGSTDGTAQRAARYSDPRITLVRQANGGESVARNTALQNMHGELVAFLDADDFFMPRHLERTVGYLHAHPERDGVYTDGFHCDEGGVRLKPLSSRRRGPFEGWLFEELVRASDVFGPPLCLVLRRRNILEQGLSFDPAIVIGPDWDFTIHYAHSARFGYVDECTCQYRVHQTNITVRTGVTKRTLSLARCREKAIKLPNFTACSLETRRAVFYELLVNLLRGLPERQSAVVGWPEFTALPVDVQAELLQLMASTAILMGLRHTEIGTWLRTAQALSPTNRRVGAIAQLYALSPRMCQIAVRVRRTGQVDLFLAPPLGDVVASNPSKAN